MMSTLEVSGQQLLDNVRAIELAIAEAAGSSATGDELPLLLGVVKANGYGHSATLCAPVLADAGISWLGVTDAEEGVAVRQSLGERNTAILMMSGPTGDQAGARQSAEMALRHGLMPVVWTAEQVDPIAAAASGLQATPLHLEIDTGMSRQGVAPGKALKRLLEMIALEPRVRLDGVMTHLASAERADGRQTMAQMSLFEAAVETVAAAGLRPRWVHIGNASTIDNASVDAVRRTHALAGSIGARAMVRCGLGLYGFCLPVEGAGRARLRDRIRPVLSWKTSITAVEEIAAETSVGYGAAFTARRWMRLALLPVGYADGLRRGLSSSGTQAGGWVMIAGQRAAIVGRVSMNLTTVDVTGIEPAPRSGDEVTLLGEGITAEDHARLCGALP